MSDIPVGTYERIFKHKKRKDIKIEYQRNPPEQQEIPTNINVILVDDNGKKIEKITAYHKNKIYKQVKALKENLQDNMCTKSECWNPNKENVDKMVREMRNPRISAYKLAMKAIGAEPRDCNPELLRRGR